MPSVIAVAVWHSVRYYMVLFLAGLQSIPAELYEAARVDGADPWRSFWLITLPLLRPTLLFVIVINTLASLQVFDLVFILTNGGPVNATTRLVLHMYRTAFEFIRMGRVTAMAMLLFVVVFAITFISFYLVRQLGWVDTYPGLIVPNLVTAFGIFLLRQYMLSLPDELLDAARIDGAPEFTIYWRIVLPLVGPALGALAILAFVYHWNSFLWPLIVVRSPGMMTVPLALNSLRIYASSPEVINLQMAGATAAILPVLLVFPLLQRWFVQGIALTGLKG